MKIYTRTGDKGQTSLYGGKRISKASDRVDTYGTVDELNSILGVVVANLEKGESAVAEDLQTIQRDLFSIGASLANPDAKPLPYLLDRVTAFEKRIDALTKPLPELRNFILPGGGKAGSMLHQARTVCRRAERRVVALSQDEVVDSSILQYFNRLSDLFFTMARFVNYKEQKKETKWLKPA